MELSQEELAMATDDLIGILKATNYFDFVDSRIVGWPESDSRYPWWGSYWSGMFAEKKDGRITYTQAAPGADNNGERTAPFLEGACYAFLLSGDERYAHLARKMVRAYTGWVLSSSTGPEDTAPKTLNRVFMPENVLSLDGGKEIYLNYEPARREVRASNVSTVHLPNNPYYGDIYIRNGRSVDDLGHMIRAMTLVQAGCEEVFSRNEKFGPDARKEFEDLKSVYARWAEDVEADDFVIPTIDANGHYSRDDSEVSEAYTRSILGENPLCTGKFDIRLLHENTPGDLHCGSGVSGLEIFARNFFPGHVRNDALQISRSHHATAVALARKHGLHSDLGPLVTGYAERIKYDLDKMDTNLAPEHFNKRDVHELLVWAANLGVPLTTMQIRWLHQQIHESYVFYMGQKDNPAFRLFEDGTPDGSYSYIPPEGPGGLWFSNIGMMLGACASPYRDMSRQILDCRRLRKALRNWSG